MKGVSPRVEDKQKKKQIRSNEQPNEKKIQKQVRSKEKPNEKKKYKNKSE